MARTSEKKTMEDAYLNVAKGLVCFRFEKGTLSFLLSIYVPACLSVCLSIVSSTPLLTWQIVSLWKERQIEKKRATKKNDQQAVSIMGWVGLSWERVFFLFTFFVPDVKRWSAQPRTLLCLFYFFLWCMIVTKTTRTSYSLLLLSMRSISTHHTNGSLSFCIESLAIVMRSRSQQQIK